jgi:hypothetical protein
MKKNFLTVAAMAVVAFFVSTEIAKAADITFSGQIRTRWEVNEHSGNLGTVANSGQQGNFNNNPDDFIFSSVRLAADAKINDTTSAFIQMQSVRNWGNTRAGTAGSGAGTGNASFTANNTDASVGVHQAYFTLKNFANLPVPVDLKLGRQEVKLDGWRLFGNTIWTPGMQTHDAIRLTHSHDNMSLVFAYILAQEDGRSADFKDGNDADDFLAYFSMKGVLGGQFSAIYNYLGRSNTAAAQLTGGSDDDSFSTIGARQAGQLFGLDYRGEVYYQWGQAGSTANAITTSNQAAMEAYMFGVRVGKTFNNVMFKPGVTLWYDYLSGTSDSDQAAGKWKSFNTLFDTGHKFYGLQDLFLGVGGGGAAGTRGLGLEDLAIKFKLNPMPGWTLKLDAHAFATAVRANNNPLTLGIANANNAINGEYLGNEFDLTLVNKYNANTKVMLGFSNFNGTNTFRAIKGATVGSSDANWAYVQFDVQF